MSAPCDLLLWLAHRTVEHPPPRSSLLAVLLAPLLLVWFHNLFATVVVGAAPEGALVASEPLCLAGD